MAASADTPSPRVCSQPVPLSSERGGGSGSVSPLLQVQGQVGGQRALSLLEAIGLAGTGAVG